MTTHLITLSKSHLSIGSLGVKLSVDRYFFPPSTECTKRKNIPTAANENPAWKFNWLPKIWKPKPSAAHGTSHGAMKEPKLIPKTKILKPASRRRSSTE